MRYTVDDLADDSWTAFEDPIVVEVLDREAKGRPIRGAGDVVLGMAAPSGVGRRSAQLHADSELIERLEPLRLALRELDDHIDATHTVHKKDGSEPSFADEEAEIRERMRFLTLLAHAVMAVELVADEA